MNSNNDYEKINLSKQDLRYVYSQILNKTTSKLDLHLPTTNNDPLKNKVANVLDDFLMGSFELAKSSLIIDGRDMSQKGNYSSSISELLSLKPREKVEDFDVSINAKLREILLKVEEATTEVAKLRRELPSKAKEVYKELVTKTDNEVSSILADLDVQETQAEEATNLIPNINEIVDDYQAHILTLNELKKAIPERKAELDRLDDTIRLLESAYKQQQEEEL